MKLAKFCREKKILKMTSFSTFLKKLVVNQSRIKIRILMAFKGGFLTESRVFLYLADSPKHWPKKGKIFPLMKWKYFWSKMTVCGGGVSGGAAVAAETSPIISWLSKQRQSEWPHRLLPVLLLLPISHFVSCSPHDVLTKKIRISKVEKI